MRDPIDAENDLDIDSECAIMSIEKALPKSGSAPLAYLISKMPSLGTVAASAFYSERYCISENMKRQCNWHANTPFRRCSGTAFFHFGNAYPCGQLYSTESDKAFSLMT